MEEKLNFILMVVNHPLLSAFVREKSVRVYIACQFALESAFGSSRLAIMHSNYCGMKRPHRRLTFSIKKEDGQVSAHYASFDDCVCDYLSWIFYNRPYNVQLQSVDSFRMFLRENGYCPEESYLSRIDAIFNRFINLIP